MTHRAVRVTITTIDALVTGLMFGLLAARFGPTFTLLPFSGLAVVAEQTVLR